jgi:hypothetical protein
MFPLRPVALAALGLLLQNLPARAIILYHLETMSICTIWLAAVIVIAAFAVRNNSAAKGK